MFILAQGGRPLNWLEDDARGRLNGLGTEWSDPGLPAQYLSGKHEERWHLMDYEEESLQKGHISFKEWRPQNQVFFMFKTP